VYVIDSAVDKQEDSPSGPDDPHHRLAFAEAAHNFVECNYRFPEPNATEMAALLLHSLRGPFDAERDTLAALTTLVEDVVPRYLLTDRTDVTHITPSEVADSAKAAGTSSADIAQRLAAGAMAGRRWAIGEVFRRVGCVDATDPAAGPGSDAASEQSTEAMAMTLEQAAERLHTEYSALAATPRFEAETKFVQKVKEFVAFGSDVYVGKRTWRANDADATEDDVMERTEDVTVCVAYSGVVFTGLTHPLGCEEHKFDSITKWTLSEDSRVFAFQVEEQAADNTGLFKFVVYVVTEQAPEVEQSVDRFVDALVAHSQSKLESSRSNSSFEEPAKWVATDERPPADCVPEGGASWDGAASAAPASASSPASEAAAAESPAAADPDALPPGWTMMFDDDGDAYFYNEDTEETQWERPAGAAVGAAAADDSAASAEPAALPAGWESRFDDDGDEYFYNPATEETQWERPTEAAAEDAEPEEDALPEGWEARYDDDGDVYYYNEATEVTQWERPAA